MSKRGQMIPRGLSKWLLRVYIGRNAEGKRQYDSKMFEGTTKQAQQEITKMLSSVDTQTHVRPTKETLKEFLKRWLAAKLDVAARTKEDYSKLIESYIIPALGHIRVTDLTPVAVQGFYGALHERGLSPRTIRYVHTTLHQALNLAIEWGLLIRNPTSKAKLPKKVKRAPTILDAEQINTLLAHSKDDPLHALWRLLLTSGFRPEEALAMKWLDLVLDDNGRNGTLVSAHMRRTLVNDGKGNYSVIELEGKTAESVRAVTLPWSTWESLQSHTRRQAAEILLAGPNYKRQDFLFATRQGDFLDPNWVRRKWKAALRAAKLPECRLYDTRHSHATALLTKGVNLTWVSERLGHADVKITQDVYAHVLPEAHAEMALVMEKIVSTGTDKH